MYFYFSSICDSALKINGEFKKIISDKVSSFNLNLNDNPFIELCPVNQGVPLSFILDEKFLSSPKGVSIIDLKGGYFIRFNEISLLSQFEIIKQEKFQNAVVTLLKENGISLSIETPFGILTDKIYYDIKDVNFTVPNFYNSNLLIVSFILKTEEEIVILYDINKTPQKLSSKKGKLSISESGFSITENLKDIAKHSIITEYSFSNGKILENNKTVTCSPSFIPESVTEKLVPYAFIEEFLVKGNYDFYLAENIKEKSEFLSEYLENFCGIFIPPPFRNYDEIGLIYKKSENLFFADYLSFETENKKITNIKRLSD